MGLIKIPEQSVKFFNDNLSEIFEFGFLAEGPWNKKLSEFVIQTTGSKCAIPTNSNGSGLVALLNIYKQYFGRKIVIIQSNTMYGVKTMVPSGGCQFDGFIECQLDTLMPSLGDVEATIAKYDNQQKNSLIILLSHIGGIVNPDIQAISDLCRQENIVLLEDCAHSFAATLNGKHSGLFGDAGVYSFYSTKAIPAGEGGIVVSNNEDLGKLVSNFGIYDRFEQKMEIGFNNRISEVQALLTYSVVREWKTIFENKREIALCYIKACNELGVPFIAQEQDGQNGNYYKFVIYNEKMPISEYLPGLKTTTSPVYDYSIGVDNPLAKKHDCLPIWYGQEFETTQKVVNELQDSLK